MASDEYKIQTGDVLSIWLAQDSVLSGDIAVGPDGRLSMPLVGSTVAAGKTITELQTTLTETLQPFFLETINLNLSLKPDARHAPMIYVVGDVTTSGVFAHRPNVTVLHAVAMAGGLYRTNLLTADQDRSLQLTSQISANEQRVADLTIRMARLTAQLGNKTSFDLPEGISGPAAEAVRGREQTLLDTQLERQRIQEQTAKRLLSVADEMEASISAQLESIAQKTSLTEERIAATKQLVERGVVQSSQLRDAEADLLTLEGTKSQLMGQLATQKSSTLSEQSRLEALKQDVRIDLTSQTAAIEAELRQLKETLADQRMTLQLYANSNVTQQGISYEIVRTNGDAVETIVSSEDTLVLPGDLIRVRRIAQ